jgi:hypothetical protein
VSERVRIQAVEQQQNEYVSAFKLLTKKELDEVYEMILDLEKLETPQRDLSPEEKNILSTHERRFRELLDIAAKRSPTTRTNSNDQEVRWK